MIPLPLHSWVRLGTPKEKLIIGMPTYGRSFTLTDPNRWIVNSPSTGGGEAGKYTGESGFMAYYEVSISNDKKDTKKVIKTIVLR